MVGAAIFFPITIFAAMSLIYLFLNLYSQACLQSKMHLDVRKQAAEEGGRTTVYITDMSIYETDKYRSGAEASAPTQTKNEKSGSYQSISSSDTEDYYGNELTNPDSFRMEFGGSSYVINEAKCVRVGKFIVG